MREEYGYVVSFPQQGGPVAVAPPTLVMEDNAGTRGAVDRLAALAWERLVAHDPSVGRWLYGESGGAPLTALCARPDGRPR